MKRLILLAGAALALAACGDDGGAPSLASSCRTICNQAFTCWGEDFGDEDAPGLIAECEAQCAEIMQTPEVGATCASCASDVSCGLLELCLDGQVCEAPRAEVVVEGSGFDAWEGARVRIVSVAGPEPEDGWYERGADAVISGGGFSVTLPAALAAGDHLEVAVWVDADGDRACDVAGSDLVFRQAHGTAEGGARTVHVTPQEEDDDPDACYSAEYAAPTLFVEGTGAAGDWALVTVGDSEFGGEVQIARVRGGRFSVRFDYVYSAELEIAWLVDDGDWLCEPGRDRGGVAVHPFDGLQHKVTIDAREGTEGFCSRFPFLGHDVRFRSTGWSDHEGRNVFAELVDEAGTTVAWEDDTFVDGGAIEFTFGGRASPGVRYRVEFYVDRDENWMCQGPEEARYVAEVGVVNGDTRIERARDQLERNACR